MHSILHIFDLIFKIPLFNALIFLYQIIPGHDMGIAIIVLTVVLRLLLWPLAAKALHSQRTLQSLQPQINKIREQHKDNPQEMNQAVMNFYKEKEINPFSSCFPTLVQFPFLIALYLVFIAGLNTHHLNLLYSFVPHPHSIDPTFLGLINLGKPDHSLILPILAAGLQYYQSKMLLPPPSPGDASAQTARSLTYFLPAMTFFFGLTLPAALPLYWVVTTLFAILQQRTVMRRDIHILEDTPLTAAPVAEAEGELQEEKPKHPKSKRKGKKR
jgi:YidC/Oxa1 family membrane protein insertase